MALYHNVCNDCGYAFGAVNYMPKTRTCPICKGTAPAFIIHETRQEKESREKAERQGRRTFIFALGMFIISLLLLYPGALLLMLLHKFIDIDSSFWNWLLCIILSYGVYIMMKCNLIKYLLVDAGLIFLTTIVCWCVEPFKPWSFLIDALAANNGLLIVLDIFLGVALGAWFIPSQLPPEYREGYKERVMKILDWHNED